MLIYSHWTMFSLGWDCLLSRAIALNWSDNFPVCPISPLFPGYLLTNSNTFCLFLLPSCLDNDDHLVILLSLATGGLQIQRLSMPSIVHPPTRSVSTWLLVSLLIWYKMEGTFPWLWVRVGHSLFHPPKWPGMLVKEVCSYTHMPSFPHSVHLISFLKLCITIE